MNIYIKEVLLDTFLDALKKELVEVIKEIPEEWDGVELRWLLRDKAAESVWYSMVDKRSKRYKDYKNFLLVNNL